MNWKNELQDPYFCPFLRQVVDLIKSKQKALSKMPIAGEIQCQDQLLWDLGGGVQELKFQAGATRFSRRDGQKRR